MKKSKLLALLALALTLVVVMTSCELLDDLFGHKCENVCEECGKCLNAECAEEACAEKCPGHVPYIPAPVITVEPAELEIYAGEEIDPMFGVSVSDENDEKPTLIIEDDGGFDANTEGVYTITYKAVNKDGKSSTATRKITVLKAKSALVLEVKANLLGDNKWSAGCYINFANALYQELTANTTIETITSGVFHNNTDAPITLTVFGDYGEAAIIDANGVVIEGRDGSAGRLVNADNPIRTSAPQGATIEVGGENVSLASNFAKNMTIPAGGYAIVVQTGFAGEGFDADGRGFMAYNVIYRYGNVVSLKWADSGETLTTYQDQAPTIEKNDDIVVGLGDLNFDLDTAVLAGLIAKDDNGTFAADDDAVVEVTVKSNGGFDINTVGVYEIVLTATDGTNVTEVVRVVKVISDTITIEINGSALTIEKSKWLYNTEVNANTTPKYSVIVFDKNYEGTFATNGFGAALVIDQYGRLVKIYDGANLGYWTADGKADKAHFGTGDYATVAWSELQDGELLIICPNDAGANASRGWALALRDIGKYPSIGEVISIPGFTFEEAPHECAHKCEECGKCTSDCADAVCAEKCEGHAHECESKCEICGKCLDAECTEAACAEKCEGHHVCAHVCSVCSKCTGDCTEAVCAEKCAGHTLITIDSSYFEVLEGNVAIDQDLTALGAYQLVIYTPAYEGSLNWSNGWGEAFVLNQYGEVVRVYDGVSQKYFDADNTSGVVDTSKCTSGGYLKEAFASLGEGEYLVVGPNGNGNVGRTFLYGCRVIGAKATIPGITFASKHVCESVCDTCGKCVDKECTETVCAAKCDCIVITIGENTLKIAAANIAIDQDITALGGLHMVIYTPAYEGSLNWSNGWGEAFVLNQYGEVVRVYDGVSQKYFDADNTSGVVDTSKCTSGGYLKEAFASLGEGEYLVVGPNGNGNVGRTFLYGNRKPGAQFTITGITFAVPHACESVCDTCGKCVDRECTEAVCAAKCDCIVITIGENTLKIAAANIAIDQDITALGGLHMVIYTPAYEGSLNWSNGWGEAFVLNQYGEVVRVYDGVSQKYFDADNTSGVVDTSKCTSGGYLKEAFASLGEGEYLVVGPNGNGNVGRTFLYGNRKPGAQFTITGITFAVPHACESVCATCGKCADKECTEAVCADKCGCVVIKLGAHTLTVAADKWLYNTEIDTANASKYGVIAYDKNYTGTFTTNGYGAALVFDQYGRLVKIYDAANMGYWTDNTSAKTPHYTKDNYATVAWSELQDGELLLIFPNDGGSNPTRGWALKHREIHNQWADQEGSIGKVVSITGFTFATAE